MPNDETLSQATPNPAENQTQEATQEANTNTSADVSPAPQAQHDNEGAQESTQDSAQNAPQDSQQDPSTQTGEQTPQEGQVESTPQENTNPQENGGQDSQDQTEQGEDTQGQGQTESTPSAPSDTDSQDSTQDQSGQQDSTQGQDIATPPTQDSTDSTDSAPLENSGQDSQENATDSQDSTQGQTEQGQQESTQGQDSQDQEGAPIFPNDELAPKPPALPDMSENEQDSTNAKLEAFITELNEAINANAGVIESTHFSLRGIATLLEVSKDLWEFYSYSTQNLKLNNADFEKLKSSYELIRVHIQSTLNELHSVHNTSLNIFKSTEALLDETKAGIAKIGNDISTAKETLTQIKALELKLPQIKELNATLSALIAQAQAMKDEINALVPNILNEVKTELLSAKESHEQELEAKKDEFIELFEGKIEFFNQKVSEFNDDYALKQTVINQSMRDLENAHNRLEELNEKISQSEARIEANKQEVLATIAGSIKELRAQGGVVIDTMEQYKDSAIKSITNAKSELESKKDEYISTLETAKDTHISTLGQATQTHSTELESQHTQIQEHLNTMSENIKINLDSVAASQIADLTTIVQEIKAKQTALGANFQHQNFTADGTFTKPENAIYFYVFVQGGIGASNATTAGGASSFGSLLSANGGSGSPQGAGQSGEAKGAFVEITDEQTPVVVGSGGIVMVSWSNRGNTAGTPPQTDTPTQEEQA